MKIISWNVNGIRAIVKKNFFEAIDELQPDVLCLQETKAQVHQVEEALAPLEGYSILANEAEKKGYSGTAILTKKEPISHTVDIGVAEHDQEGRVVTVEYADFYLVTVYVPNSGSELKRLDYRQTWDKAFLDYLKVLEKTKPVVACGDFNVAHREIDLARPKQNYNKSAGFMQEEIDGFDAYVASGMVDTFRFKYPERGDLYTWWSFRGGARDRNVGWRIDYFICSESFTPHLQDAKIHDKILGSDHCPVEIEIQ